MDEFEEYHVTLRCRAKHAGHVLRDVLKAVINSGGSLSFSAAHDAPYVEDPSASVEATPVADPTSKHGLGFEPLDSEHAARHNSEFEMFNQEHLNDSPFEAATGIDLLEGGRVEMDRATQKVLRVSGMVVPEPEKRIVVHVPPDEAFDSHFRSEIQPEPETNTESETKPEKTDLDACGPDIEDGKGKATETEAETEHKYFRIPCAYIKPYDNRFSGKGVYGIEGTGGKKHTIVLSNQLVFGGRLRVELLMTPWQGDVCAYVQLPSKTTEGIDRIVVDASDLYPA